MATPCCRAPGLREEGARHSSGRRHERHGVEGILEAGEIRKFLIWYGVSGVHRNYETAGQKYLLFSRKCDGASASLPNG